MANKSSTPSEAKSFLNATAEKPVSVEADKASDEMPKAKDAPKAKAVPANKMHPKFHKFKSKG